MRSGSCSPAPPATSAGGCCASSKPRGCASAVWCGGPSSSRAIVRRPPRSSAATSAIPRRSSRRCAASRRPTTWSTRWAPPSDFEERDRARRGNLRRGRAAAGVRRIVYLGGLGDERDELSRAPAQPPRGRPHPARVGRAGRRVPRLDRHRLGQPLVRDDPRARRAAAGDDHAALGRACCAQPIAHRGRARLPARRARCSSCDESRVYEIGGADRVSYGDLMREYARQRGLRRFLIPRAGADAAPLEPVARAGDAALRARRPQAHRQHLPSDRRARRPAPAQRFRDPPDRRARGDRARARQRGSRVRRDALVGRALLGRRAARVGRRRASATALVDSRSVHVAGVAGRRVRADPPDRRRDRLVLRRLAVAPARLPRPARRRRRHAARAPRSRAARGRRRARLLARRGDRARSPAAPRRRDEAARPRLARVRGDARRRRRRSIRQTAIFDPVGLAGLAYWYGIYPLHELVFARHAARHRAGGLGVRRAKGLDSALRSPAARPIRRGACREIVA